MENIDNIIDAVESTFPKDVSEVWHVVSIDWWKKFLESKGGSTSSSTESDDLVVVVPPIDSKSLLYTSSSSSCVPPTLLRNHLLEGQDYKLVRDDIWNKLSSVYGTTSDSPDIIRPVVKRGGGSSLSVQVYPPVLQVLYWKLGAKFPEAIEDNQRPLYWMIPSSVSGSDLLRMINTSESTENMNLQWKDSFINTSTVRLMLKRQASDDEWMPLGNDSTLEDFNLKVFINDNDNSQIVLEECGDNNECASEIAAKAWRSEITKTSWIDALDSESKWYEAEVIEATEDEVKVHYKGWTDKWDTWHNRFSDKIAPLYTHVSPWRRDLRVGDNVELGQVLNVVPKWSKASVVAVEDLRVCLKKSISKLSLNENSEEKVWVDRYGDLICEDGTHTKIVSSSSSYTPYRSIYHDSTYSRHRTGRPAQIGAVGLQNLGNTCFMNSMIQCLSNCPVLTSYFCNESYKAELNRDNPLGAGGRIAEAYGELMIDIWSGKYSEAVPSTLKSVIGTHAPMFAGYQQQDSQELMSFLLDGLHEDLNRVIVKPYVASVDSNGREDKIVAAEAWEAHQSRNQSVIVDNCVAQLRSHITCPICGMESITFDPYMSLSVPLPVSNTRPISLLVFWANGDVPTRFSVRVDKNGSIADVKEALAALLNTEERCVSASNLILLEVFSHRVSKVHLDTDLIYRIRSDQCLDVYELEVPLSQHVISSTVSNSSSYRYYSYENDDDTRMTKSMRLVSVMHRAPSQNVNTDNNNNTNEEHSVSKYRRIELFGTPMIISIPLTNVTTNMIHTKMWTVVKRLLFDETGCFSSVNPPYKIEVADASGTNVYCDELPHDDEVFSPPNTSNSKFSFTLEWTNEGYTRGYRESEAQKVVIHESMAKLNTTSNTTSHSTTEASSLSLNECVLKFTEREQLGESDPWYCSRCKEHRQAFKKFDLWSVPKVLILHLKRFRYAQGSMFMHRDKIDTKVDFPISALDMSQYVVGPQRNNNNNGLMYDLFAVSEHSGGLGGGHYTAIAKNAPSGKWFDFNDSFVTETTAEKSISSQAYVLFYVRRGST